MAAAEFGDCEADARSCSGDQGGFRGSEDWMWHFMLGGKIILCLADKDDVEVEERSGKGMRREMRRGLLDWV